MALAYLAGDAATVYPAQRLDVLLRHLQPVRQRLPRVAADRC